MAWPHPPELLAALKDGSKHGTCKPVRMTRAYQESGRSQSNCSVWCVQRAVQLIGMCESPGPTSVHGLASWTAHLPDLHAGWRARAHSRVFLWTSSALHAMDPSSSHNPHDCSVCRREMLSGRHKLNPLNPLTAHAMTAQPLLPSPQRAHARD